MFTDVAHRRCAEPTSTPIGLARTTCWPKGGCDPEGWNDPGADWETWRWRGLGSTTTGLTMDGPGRLRNGYASLSRSPSAFRKSSSALARHSSHTVPQVGHERCFHPGRFFKESMVSARLMDTRVDLT